MSGDCPKPLCASRYFPPIETSTPEGLLALGGRLNTDWLLDAYTHGIFPWPVNFRDEKEPVLAWWSPEPRGVFQWGGIHVPRSLDRFLHKKEFEVRCDVDFPAVIRACANARGREREGTWITPAMIRAYCELHRRGWAHSVEVRKDGILCGGVYGVAIGGLFAAESMFYREANASKIALVRLLHHLFVRKYRLIDIQMITDHTARFGAVEIPRTQYLRRLQDALEAEVSFGDRLEDFPADLPTGFSDRG